MVNPIVHAITFAKDMISRIGHEISTVSLDYHGPFCPVSKCGIQLFIRPNGIRISHYTGHNAVKLGMCEIPFFIVVNKNRTINRETEIVCLFHERPCRLITLQHIMPFTSRRCIHVE
ncbi:hypothetical protein D3C85_1268090 [compost metagenome]